MTKAEEVRELAEWHEWRALFHLDINNDDTAEKHRRAAELLEEYASLIETYHLPRTEPPTVEEYGSFTKVLYWYEGIQIPIIEYADTVRISWQQGDRWLPLPKIEEGA